MSKQQTLLSDTSIRKAKAKDKEYTMSDGGSGLTIRVFRTGRKSFGWRYVDKHRNGKMSRIEYGDYPSRTLADARQIHISAKSARKNGKDLKDPDVLNSIIFNISKEKQISKPKLNSYTVSDLVSDYWEHHVDKNIKDKKPYKSRIKKHFLSKFSESSAGDIEIKRIREHLITIQDNHSHKTMCDVARFNKSMWAWGIKNFKVDSNPFENISTKAPSKSRTQYYSIEDLWYLLVNPQSVVFPKDHYSIMKALILSGNRINELLKSQISEFDFDHNIWTIPPENLKSNKQTMLNDGTAKPFYLPMSRQFSELLRDCIGKYSNKTHVFATRKKVFIDGLWQVPDTGHLDERTWRNSINEYRSIYSITGKNNHDFRRTLETHLGDLGTPDEITSSMTAHQRKGMSKVYNHSKQIHSLRTGYQLWADFLDYISQKPVSISKKFDLQVPGPELKKIYQKFHYQVYLMETLSMSGI